MRGQKKEAMDPIMMDEEQTKEIMERVGVTCSGRPYQYKINRKKRAVAEREGLDSDEEEVEDLHVTRGRLRKYCVPHMRGKPEVRGLSAEEGSPFQI
jgi:hypothetical protein